MSTLEANTEKLISELKRMMRDSQDLLQSTVGAVGFGLLIGVLVSRKQWQ